MSLLIKEDALHRRFGEYWQSHFGNLPAGPVLVAVSGGSDSMALAHLMLHSSIAWAIGHCNFGLRGAESDGDAAFVKDWAVAHNIPHFETFFDTQQACKEWGCGIQEGARKLRYEWLEGLRKEGGFCAIATAHHADDSAETLLLNLFRGTGVKGLRGILPQRGNIIRPLLFAQKKDLQDFLSRQGVSFREDASNALSDYARNALRHKILPLLLEQYPQALSAIAQTATRVAAAGKLHAASLKKLQAKLVQQRGPDWYLPIKLWQKTAGWEALFFEVFSNFGFAPAATQEIATLFGAQTGRYLESPTHRVVRHRDFLVVTRRQETETDLIVIKEGIEEIFFAGGKLRFRYKAAGGKIDTGEENAQISLPAHAWPLVLVLRRARAGDYFYPLGMGGKKKKVSRFLTDLKLPRTEKERTWILETASGQIVWVVGRRIDERFKRREGEGGLEIWWMPSKA